MNTSNALPWREALDELRSRVHLQAKFPARVAVDWNGPEPIALLEDLPRPHLVWGARHQTGLSTFAGELPELASTKQKPPPPHSIFRAFGGTSFQPGDASGPSTSSRWFVPRFEFEARQLTVNLSSEADIALALDDLDTLAEAKEHAIATLSGPESFTHWPERNEWHGMVLQALDLIDAKALDKLVLARRTDVRFTNPVPALSYFRSVTDKAEASFRFYLSFETGEAFFGVSPERLYQRHGKTLHVDVLAGTRPRHADPAADQRLATELANSDKDQREHEIVRKAILQGLHRLASHVEPGGPAQVLTLPGKHHLYAEVSAHLKASVDDAQLLASLHPTPAVGGYPTDNALDEIRRLEPFPRGWYAGPVGWIGPESAEFCVAIRSAFARGNQLFFYAGAGIVPGSDPGREWDEVDNKIADLLKALPPSP